jgi:hypothetical protein
MEISNNVDAGERLSEAMSKHRNVFSEFHISVVRSGETSGKLDESLIYLADEEEKNYEMVRKLKGAMTYPVIILITMAGVGVAMTLSVWVKLSSYGAGGGGYLINKGDAASGGHGWSLFISQSNGLITFTARYNTTNLLSQGALNTFSLSDMNKWVHIMVTWDGSANSATGVHIYKNGNEISYSSQVNGSSSYLSDAANNLNIGDGGLISGRQTNGILDDVRIYNRVLSARELSQIYSSGASSKQSSSIPITNATSTCSIGLSCGLVTYCTCSGYANII